MSGILAGSILKDMKTKINYSELNWDSISGSVRYNSWKSVIDSTWDFVKGHIDDSVCNSICNRVRDSVTVSVMDFVMDSIKNYIERYENKNQL